MPGQYFDFNSFEANRILPHQAFIRRLRRPSAEWYIERKLPGLSDGARAYLLHIAETNLPKTPPKSPKVDEPLFCAAMFMAGISLGQLGQFYGTTRQSVQVRIGRRLSPAERHASLREDLITVSPELIEIAHELFAKMEPATPDQEHPVVLGRALVKAPEAILHDEHADTALAHPASPPHAELRPHATTTESPHAEPRPTDAPLAAPPTPAHTPTIGQVTTPEPELLDTPAAEPPGALGDATLRELNKLFGSM